MQSALTLSLSEAAKYLNASPCFVSKLARDGDLAGCKVGKSWVFRLSDVDGYLQSRIDARAALHRMVTAKPGRARRKLPALV